MNDYGFEIDTPNDYGFEPSKGVGVKTSQGKVGKVQSALYGAAEGALAIPALLQTAVRKPLNYIFGESPEEKKFYEEESLASNLGKFPESEDEASRRIRTGVAGATTGALGGIAGIVAGLVGSQAGQTVREVYGNEGKFEEFGWGEVGAITADLVAGLGAGVATSLARGAKTATTKAATQVPAIFGEGNTALERAVIKNIVQGERNALENIINDFSNKQIQGFEKQTLAISPDKYTDLADAGLASQQRAMQNAYVQGNLNIISPLQVTPEQGGRAIQAAANETFQTNVIKAEQAAYSNARELASGVIGEAPKTIEEAVKLRNSIVATTPSGEQNPVVNFLNNLISDLQETIPERIIPASNIVGPNGLPIIAEETIPAVTKPKKVAANEMVQMVQNGNHAINYGSEFREQSHRLKPIINSLREETGIALGKKPEAANAYNNANTCSCT